MIFTTEQRDRVRARILELARGDARIVAGAIVGSEAGGRVDRWSDLDLTFGLAPGIGIAEVLDDWTRTLAREHGAVHLFDLPFLTSVYRVFLFPGNLQVDVSLTPGGDFGALGPDFQLFFGTAVERTRPVPATARHLFGWGVHHAVRARFCIERKKPLQAEHWIHGVREQALTLACLRRGLETAHARGFDRLPVEVLSKFQHALVHSLERTELLRALGVGIDLLLEEAGDARETAETLSSDLRGLTEDDLDDRR